MNVGAMALNSLTCRFQSATRSFRHGNYRLFFMGQGISLIGTWMQLVALNWLVYELTNSKVLLGVVAFSSQILTFLAAPVAGVLADRANKRSLLVATQGVAMLQAAALAFLTLSGRLEIWHIIALSGLLGLVNGFDVPIRQSFVVEMVEERADLPNAIALNSFMFNGARLMGPAIAAYVLYKLGAGICFLLNAVSFLAVLGSLMAMKLADRPAGVQHPPVFSSFAQGFRYVTGSKPVFAILLLLAIISLVGTPYNILLPVFAKDILQGGPGAYGMMVSATGVGALLGALFLASRRGTRGLGGIIVGVVTLFGAAVIAFSMSRALWLSTALLVAAGFGAMVQMASCNTLVQTLVPDEMRGRMMSFYTMSFIGMAPFGSLLVGLIAKHFDAPSAVFLCGAATLAAGAIFARRVARAHEAQP